MASFDVSAREEEMRGIFGKAADAVITHEHTKFRKNAPARNTLHPDAIVAHWDEIQSVIAQKLPRTDVIGQLMKRLHMPMSPA